MPIEETGLRSRFPQGKTLTIERFDNLGRQNRLELPQVGVVFPEISIHVAAAADHFELFAFHLNIFTAMLSLFEIAYDLLVFEQFGEVVAQSEPYYKLTE